ncbi:unnamed protein product [Ambrosiozyma monospora]|uniref:Unnamed protein product n=1 Tax=Ambrosiozyma monospora TaxID=43982 RepID=A0ACB5T3Y8_AMBMO|nr:unnamed protein product [Ambrosiozyma monospora]
MKKVLKLELESLNTYPVISGGWPSVRVQVPPSESTIYIQVHMNQEKESKKLAYGVQNCEKCELTNKQMSVLANQSVPFSKFLNLDPSYIGESSIDQSQPCTCPTTRCTLGAAAFELSTLLVEL